MGLLFGVWPGAMRRTDAGWGLLVGPVAALFVGVPTALLFAGLDIAVTGFAGAWRAVPIGAALGAILGLALDWLSRNPRRRRGARELAAPVLIFALVGAAIGVSWAASDWAAAQF